MGRHFSVIGQAIRDSGYSSEEFSDAIVQLGISMRKFNGMLPPDKHKPIWISARKWKRMEEKRYRKYAAETRRLAAERKDFTLIQENRGYDDAD